MLSQSWGERRAIPQTAGVESGLRPGPAAGPGCVRSGGQAGAWPLRLLPDAHPAARSGRAHGGVDDLLRQQPIAEGGSAVDAGADRLDEWLEVLPCPADDKRVVIDSPQRRLAFDAHRLAAVGVQRRHAVLPEDAALP